MFCGLVDFLYVLIRSKETYSTDICLVYTPIFTKSQTCVWWRLSNFELPLLVQNSTYVAQIWCGLSYKVWSTFITKFGTTELFILILNIVASLLCYDNINDWPVYRIWYRVHSLSSGKVEMYLCAACHAFTLHVNAWKSWIGFVVQV